MDTVFVYIPDCIFNNRSPISGQIFGQSFVHEPARPPKRQLCTFYVSRYVADDDRSEPPNDGLQPIGSVGSTSNTQSIDGLFLRFASAMGDHLLLQNIQIGPQFPPMTDETLVKIVTYNQSIQPKISAQLGQRPFDFNGAQHFCLARARQQTFAAVTADRLMCALQSGSKRFMGALECIGQRFPVVRHTAVFQHLGGRSSLLVIRPTWPIVCTIVTDAFVGLLVTLLLLHIGHPYVRLTHYTEAIVVNVRQLLDALKGFPIGLKLNVMLNEFLLGIFTYHIELWVTFLVLIAPILNGMFVLFVALSVLGLSLQLAILSDLLVFITLHAHCFYIYTAVLYHYELVGIGALWRVLRGLCQNPLKGRVEAYDYSNSQLFLATMFFASSLFLFPTILLYYVVFAFLRFCVYCITYVLIGMQCLVMTVPVFAMAMKLRRFIGRQKNTELKCNAPVRSGLPHNRCTLTAVIGHCSDEEQHKLDASTLKRIYYLTPMMSVFEFFVSLVRGQIMGFFLPLANNNKTSK